MYLKLAGTIFIEYGNRWIVTYYRTLARRAQQASFINALGTTFKLLFFNLDISLEQIMTSQTSRFQDDVKKNLT